MHAVRQFCNRKFVYINTGKSKGKFGEKEMSFNYLSFANMPYWNVLPCGITNFGGDTQVFTIPDDIRNGNIGMFLNYPELSVLNQQSYIYNNWGAFGGYGSYGGFGGFGYYC